MTSIEWLEMEIVKLESKFPIPHAIYELCEQSKEMHKQEIIDAFEYGVSEGTLTDINYLKCEEEAEHYYNLTFKKD